MGLYQDGRIWIDCCFFAGMARSYACRLLVYTPFSVGAGHACDQTFLIRVPNAVALGAAAFKVAVSYTMNMSGAQFFALSVCNQ
ncbi:hypothetical protein [Desulfosarcina ovata]|uniref:hypothetical protein n=1 Tax=Desulfosarcina ovata TaxID=83564 RepID=UPI0012D2C653|nr:hypothetical protein [Desulfosarcina ovata]